ncbi:MAG: hypothetical protein Q9219_005080 [cf. Caloplaca sp. 3 TL-2023]
MATEKRREGHIARIKNDFGFELHDLIPLTKDTVKNIALHGVRDVEAILKFLTKQKYSRDGIIHEFHSLPSTNPDQPPPARLFHELRERLEKCESPTDHDGTTKVTASRLSSSPAGDSSSPSRGSTSSLSTRSSSLSAQNSCTGTSNSPEPPAVLKPPETIITRPQTKANKIRHPAQPSRSQQDETENTPNQPSLEIACPDQDVRGSYLPSAGSILSGANDHSGGEVDRSQIAEQEHGNLNNSDRSNNQEREDDARSIERSIRLLQQPKNRSQQTRDIPLPSLPPNPDQSIPKSYVNGGASPDPHHPIAASDPQGKAAADPTVPLPLVSLVSSTPSARPRNPMIEFQMAAIRASQDRASRSKAKFFRSCRVYRAAERRFHAVAVKGFPSGLDEESFRDAVSLEKGDEFQVTEEAAMRRHEEAYRVYRAARINRLRKHKVALDRQRRLKKLEEGVAVLRRLLQEGSIASYTGERSEEQEEGDGWEEGEDEEEEEEEVEGVSKEQLQELEREVDDGEASVAERLAGFAAAT